MKDINNIVDIQELVKQDFRDWKQYGEVFADYSDGLVILSYTPKAMYDRRWNYFERICRGLIVDTKTGGIVARPFDKFFNWTENGEKSSGHIVNITEKIDGSLGILYRLDGDYKIATRGSFHSEQAEWATKFLDNFSLGGLADSLTLLFEIVYPENRIVIDYGNRKDLVLLAARNRFTGEYLDYYTGIIPLANVFGFSLPKVYKFNDITEIIERTGQMDASEEGFVVEFSDGQRFKFKGDRYIELHRLIIGLSFKNTLAAVVSGTVDYIKSQVPNEFLGEFNGWLSEIESKEAAVRIACNNCFEVAPKESRKDFAIWANKNCKDLAHYLFLMFDGKDITQSIYQRAFENRTPGPQ